PADRGFFPRPFCLEAFVRARLTVVAALVAGLVAGGGGSNLGPRGPPPVNGLTPTGPTQVAPGETARFTATARYTDGSTKDVTAGTTWSAFPAGVLRLTSPGVFDVVAGGENRCQGSS